ncbi:hypothetical protein GX48_04088 [Paracoccidioides brasiliensis]|nr:hypothetical protein GX48_04088 [Paracoccidioides brasiliensis]
MSNKDKNIEDRIQKAVAYHQKNPNSKILPLSREFEVPYQRLRARINGRNPNAAKIPVNKRLNESQEDAIKRWVKLLDEKRIVLPQPNTLKISQIQCSDVST